MLRSGRYECAIVFWHVTLCCRWSHGEQITCRALFEIVCGAGTRRVSIESWVSSVTWEGDCDSRITALVSEIVCRSKASDCPSGGAGAEMDKPLGVQHLRLAADQGNGGGQYNYGCRLLNGDRLTERLRTTISKHICIKAGRQ
jgi:hypothetical protein